MSSIAIQEEQKTTDNTLYQLQFADELSNEQKIWLTEQAQVFANSEYLLVMQNHKMMLMDRRSFEISQELMQKQEQSNINSITITKTAENSHVKSSKYYLIRVMKY